MRIGLSKIAYVAWMTAVLTVGIGTPMLLAGDMTKLGRALTAPIVEGQALAGIDVGASEVDVVTALGVPDRVNSSPPAAGVSWKAADYTMKRSTLLRVFFREGRVDAILIMTFDRARPPTFTGTVRGIGLLSNIKAVRAAYGRGTGGRLWYPDLGIAFNPADKDWPDDERVYQIVVLRPGPNDLIETYGRLPLSGRWQDL